MKLIKLFGHILFIVILSVVTQIGGLIWLIAVLISIKIKKQKRIVFPLLYLIFNLLLVPPIASFFGRERLPVFHNYIKPINWFYPLTFRNYVKPELKKSLLKSSIDLAHLDIRITYLDANFPFFDGFPLLPHLSHDDGKKIDISFAYKDIKGNRTDKKPSISGYGAYVYSTNLTSLECIKKGYWQYDFTKHLTFGIQSKLNFDTENTKTLIQGLLYNSKIDKVFLEPYLKKELGLSNYKKIRFHGCQAVRHDDHIHLQIR
ncbi:hypothetical protein [Winogradskyella sp.]|uniref:hypothetical protein n=1 Tax=Winogradskyella sp. TaxID=1883156 RepID=UPI0025F7C228|nr:hypothetical protein [Winogradskyella sp.]